MRTLDRKPTLERREQIAQAVLRIIGERGLTTLTTATLAAEVGVTTGALYRHFANFPEILEEAVRYGVEQVEATFPDPALPPLQRLLALARNRIQLLGEDSGLSWLLRSEQAYLTLPPDAAARLRDVVGRSRKFLLTALRDGARDGSVRQDIAPELLLVPVLGTIHALIGSRGSSRRKAEARQPDAEEVLAALVRLLESPRGYESGKGNPGTEVKHRPAARARSRSKTDGHHDG